MTHCQVQVADDNGAKFRGFDGILYPETHYCKEEPRFVCDSGFKFCSIHKKSHGTKGKDGHVHTFKLVKKAIK